MKNQINGSTKKEYQGNNQEILLQAKEENQYKSDEWMTFVQFRELELKLKNAKGKGIRIIRGGKKKSKKTNKEGKFSTFGFAFVFNKDLAM